MSDELIARAMAGVNAAAIAADLVAELDMQGIGDAAKALDGQQRE